MSRISDVNHEMDCGTAWVEVSTLRHTRTKKYTVSREGFVFQLYFFLLLLQKKINTPSQSSPFTALPSMPLCAVEHDASSLSLAVEQERELVDSLKQDRALQRDGSGIADTLKSIAALSKAANIKHSLLPQGTVLQATTLYESLASTANPQTLYSLDEGEMVCPHAVYNFVKILFVFTKKRGDDAG